MARVLACALHTAAMTDDLRDRAAEPGGAPVSRAAQLARDGFLVVPDAISAADCALLMDRAAQLTRAFSPGESENLSVFSTIAQTQTTDAYFLSSGDRIRFFFEPSCVGADGRLLRPPHQALSKIGHALHDLDPVFAEFSRRASLRALCTELGIRDPQLLQSMYLFKAAHVGGEVSSHQDATFLYTEPQSCLGLWFALEDATLENGCLWALPGGHRGGLKKRFLRTPEGRTTFQVLDETPFAESQMIPLPVPRGTLIVLHGLLPHRSGPNTSSRTREAYSVHLVEGAAYYPDDNWLQRGPQLPLRGF